MNHKKKKDSYATIKMAYGKKKFGSYKTDDNTRKLIYYLNGIGETIDTISKYVARDTDTVKKILDSNEERERLRRKEKLDAMIMSGYSVHDIVEATEWARGYVEQHSVVVRGVKNVKKVPYKKSDDIKEKVIKGMKQGLSAQEISEKENLTLSAVYSHLKKLKE